MNLQDYINSFAKKKIKADINERWQSRIVAQGLDKLGADGAHGYLASYGTSMGEPKAAGFAMKAQSEGCKEMAMVFWRKAYELKFGTTPTDDALVGESKPVQGAKPATTQTLPSLPADLRPGTVVTMQPVDAEVNIEELLSNDAYCCQPKRDGKKYLIFATPDEVAFQSRSMQVKPSPHPGMSAALMEVAKQKGPFIIETEVYFRSFDGSEHRTGAQAVAWNSAHGQTHPVYPTCAIFSTLYSGTDLRNYPQFTRVAVGASIAAELVKRGVMFEPLETAFTREPKTAMLRNQEKEGREGVVFSCTDMTYRPGKIGQDYVRVKFLKEYRARITALTPTTALGKLFGAISIVDCEGNKLGKIGTGFSREDEEEIVNHFKSNPDNAWIEVASQGFTESGVAWHGRYRGIVQ